MLSRDERIIKHVALYRVSIRAVIEQLFFDGKSCDDVINRLVKEKLLTVEKLPNRISYYRLTLSAARARGVQENRAQSKGVQTRSLRRTLAMLWFCCMGERPRHRMERKTLATIFGDAQGLGIPHCWEQVDPQQRVVYRVYTPGPNTPSDDVVRTLQLDAGKALADPTLAKFIFAKAYSFVVLVEHPDRKAILEEQLREGPPPPVPVTIEFVPNIHDLADEIRTRKTTREPLHNG